MSLTAGKAILLSSAAGGGYEVSRSLRFNSSDSAYLSRTPASAGNRKTWTWAAWVKRSALGAKQYLFKAGVPGSTDDGLLFTSSDTLQAYTYSGGGFTSNLISTQVFRDCSAWYHIVWTWDTDNGTAAQRSRLYVNGQEITAFGTSSYPSSGLQPSFNNNVGHSIGSESPNALANYLSGYLAEIHFIDGQALTPSSFTEVSATTGQLIPKAYSGTFGTNGFWLKFSDNSATTATTLGKDYSGNSNNWTPNNFSVGNSVVISSPVRFTWATAGTNWTLSNSDYTATYSGTTTYSALYSIALDGSTTYRFIHRQTAGDSVGGWFLKDSTGAVSTHPDELGGNSLGQRIGEDGIGTYGTFATANGTSSGQDQILGFSSITPTGTGATNYSEWVINMSVRKVWVRQAGSSTWIKGGDPSNTSSTPSFSLPSGTIYFGYVGYSSTGITSIDTSSPATNGKDIDSLVDTPTSYGIGNSGGDVRGNYCTWNPLTGNLPLRNGNLDAIHDAGDWKAVLGTIAVSSGKWYWEITSNTDVSGTGNSHFGIALLGYNALASNTYIGNTSTSYAYRGDGTKYTNNTPTSYGSGIGNGTVVGVALDLDAGTLTFYNNGVSQGTAFGSLSGTFFPAVSHVSTSSSSVNFGQRAFAYTPPANHKALVDTNLPAPVVAKPSESAFDVKLWTGNGSSQSITTSFSPDFVWIKNRNTAGIYHNLFDSVRGTGKVLFSNTTDSEVTNSAYGYLNSFDSNGFGVTVGASGGDNTNYTNWTYVGWCWDAGSSTVTNTQGSISSQVRANASAGFSIVTYSFGNAPTVGHGLGVAPSLIIAKSRTVGTDWVVYHRSLGKDQPLVLNDTGAALSISNYWGTSEPSSTVFGTFGNNTNSNNRGDMVAYCFAPVAGYSSFGSYTGNGSSDGPFVWCGFRPRWILVKKYSDVSPAENWVVWDAARDTSNTSAVNPLFANSSQAELSNYTTGYVDGLSNGFKARGSWTAINGSGSSYVYCAFAESPFQYARAR